MRRRYIFSQGEMIEVSQDWRPEAKSDLQIVADIDDYKSMIDGSIITSRSKHRSHLRQHGCVEVGNDSLVKNPQYKPLVSPPGLKDLIIRVANEKLRYK